LPLTIIVGKPDRKNLENLLSLTNSLFQEREKKEKLHFEEKNHNFQSSSRFDFNSPTTLYRTKL